MNRFSYPLMAFEQARKLYVSFGFSDCPPFSDFTNDPNGHFMTKRL
jgi:putative acetyltransferase